MKTKPPPYSFKEDVELLPKSFESGVHSYLHILRNRKGILLGSVVFVISIAFFVNLMQKPVYEAKAELVLQPKDSKATLSTQLAGFFLQDPTLLLTQFRLIRGPHLSERALKKLEKPENRTALLEAYSIRPSGKRKENEVFSEKERQALRGAIQRSLAPRQLERGSRLIAISASAYNPLMASRVANAAAEAYMELNYEANIEAFQQSFVLISKSLAEIRERIKTGEIAFQKIDSEIRLLEALKIYGERHPLVIQLRTDIPRLAQKLRRETQNLAGMQVGRRKDLVPLLMQASTTLEALQKIETDLYILRPILEQEVNTNREMYNSIFKKLQEVEVSGTGSIWVEAKMVEPAAVPERPAHPNKKLNLMVGFLVGLFLGISLAFFLEYLDSSVRSLDDIQSYLKLFPLGMVPHVEFRTKEGERERILEGEGPGREGRPLIVGGEIRPLWLASDPDVPLYVAEAYRIIRTNLAFGSVDTSLKALQVTSAVKGEGKTTTAANLALSLASAGSRTLLVDGDLRRPTLHKILGLEKSEQGLSDSLINGRSWELAVVPTAIPHLHFLSAGPIPPNPAELLSSKRMKSLVEEFKEHFDMVIFDSPPVISVADAAILASRVDGSILVSRAGFVPRYLCLQAKSTLESVNGKVVGCILNNVLSEHQPYYYHQYYRKYGYYYDEERESSKLKEKSLSLGPSETVEKLKALKEPFLVFLSTGWARARELLKWPSLKKESESSVGAP